MNLLRIFLLSALIALILSSCSKSDEQILNGTPYTLPYGEWVSGPDVQLQLSDSILDSRCPETVICVWQGMAEGLMTMKIQGVNHKLPFQIQGLCDASLSECGNVLDTLGYQIRFIRIDPYPQTPNDIPHKDYILQVDVVKK